MRTQALLLLALLGTSTFATAQAPTPGASGPSFGASDEIPSPKGYNDAYALDEVRLGGELLTEQQQIDRWQAELKAGRARAGTLVGAYLSYRALTAADCTAARDALLKADELGNDQAAWLLAQLATNKTCNPDDNAELERWLKKSVTQDYAGAATDLMRIYGGGEKPDHVQEYLYARVAAGYWESNKLTQPREGFDAAALAAMEKALTPAEKTRAETEAVRILEGMLKRHDRFIEVKPLEFTRGEAGGKIAFVGYQSDYRHECQWNLKNNCRGAQRLAYVELTNKTSEFVSCKVELRARDFVTGAPPAEPLSREVLVGAQASRKLLLGDVSDIPDKKALTANCAVVPKLAANAAAGKCKAKLQGSIDVERFYPENAKRNGTEGNVVVRYFVPPGADAPSDAEIVTSSGDLSLDVAALTTIRSGKFSRECDYGLSSIRIAFKLEDQPKPPQQ